MTDVTITLDEEMASALRKKAADEGKSVSRLISDLLEREVGRTPKNQSEAIEEFLSGPRWPISDENGRPRDLCRAVHVQSYRPAKALLCQYPEPLDIVVVLSCTAITCG